MKISFKNLSNYNPSIIAETACGHDGNYKKLTRLIDIAKKSGATAIKFQIYKFYYNHWFYLPISWFIIYS